MVFQRTVLVIMNTDMKNSAVFTTVQINQRHCPAEISIAVQLELESVSNSTGIRKLANHIAKKRAEFDGVCDLTRIDQAQRERLLGEIEVGEVWGIGRQLQQRLQAMGIHSVRDLRDADAAQLRQMVSVVLERTVRELRGISCLSLEEVVPAKQQIMVSRSFGHYVYTEAELASANSAPQTNARPACFRTKPANNAHNS
jgi:hypothetical protein